jgi:hypothetical protein
MTAPDARPAQAGGELSSDLERVMAERDDAVQSAAEWRMIADGAVAENTRLRKVIDRLIGDES